MGSCSAPVRSPNWCRVSRVTEHFDSHEFAQPARHGFASCPYPDLWVAERLRPLCQQLEILRAALRGRPIEIFSGYRSLEYNRAIKGARESQHLVGRAADIRAPGMGAQQLHGMIRILVENGEITIGGLGLYPSFVHIDTRPGTRLARWSGSRKNA